MAIAITETWLNSSTDDLYNLPDYKFVSQPRQHKSGGGVGIFVNSTFDYNICEKLCINSSIIECIFIELPISQKDRILIGCVYRPPDSDVSQFNSILLKLLADIDKKKYSS